MVVRQKIRKSERESGCESKESKEFFGTYLERNAVDSLRRNNRKVLVVYTGGTIGMMKNSQGGKLSLFLSSSLRIKTEKSTWSQNVKLVIFLITKWGV